MPLRQVKANSRLSRASGSTLIEVLVSLLVLSFGMLGMAGVQVVSLRGNQAAYFRTMATTYSVDIIERMRANISAVEGGGYDDVAGAATASCFAAAATNVLILPRIRMLPAATVTSSSNPSPLIMPPLL